MALSQTRTAKLGTSKILHHCQCVRDADVCKYHVCVCSCKGALCDNDFCCCKNAERQFFATAKSTSQSPASCFFSHKSYMHQHPQSSKITSSFAAAEMRCSFVRVAAEIDFVTRKKKAFCFCLLVCFPCEQGKMEETSCEIICGAPTTLVVKGQMRDEKKFVLQLQK